MHQTSTETLFERYRQSGDPGALGEVFDRLAPQLVLVAAHLADSALAEDLVQATFLDAIRNRERWDGTRPLAPWLTGMLGIHVHRARRERRRVPDPGRLLQREVPLPDAAAEASECIEAVRQAVERLPRHYRQVLTLRLVYGLELQQIAHAIGVPLGTVKVRLHRGLVLLRRALPAGLATALAVLVTPGPGLAAVRQLVVGEAAKVAAAVATTAIVAAGTGLVIGGLVMKQVMIGVVACVLLGVGWFAADAVMSDRAAAEPTAPAPGTVVAAAATDIGAIDQASIPEDAATSTDLPSQRTEASTTGRLELRVVWASNGAAAVAVNVTVYGIETLRPISVRTDADGRCVFDALVPDTYWLSIGQAHIENRVPVVLAAGSEERREVSITGDVRLLVTVVDDSGAPRSGAAVWGLDPGRDDEILALLGDTDASGTLSYQGLPLTSVWARLGGHEPSPPHPLPRGSAEDLPREVVAVRVVLGAAACTILGTVVDAAGRTVAAARVAVACDDTLRAARQEVLLTTDATGHFRCDEIPAGERFVVASAEGHASAVARITTTVGQPTVVALMLRQGAVLSGRVTDSRGDPLAGVMVSTRHRQSLQGLISPWGDMRLMLTDADGRYRLAAILPGETLVDVGVEPHERREFTFADGERLTWDVVQEPDRRIHGVVVDAEERPLAGWRAAVYSDRGILRGRQLAATTDAAGRFAIGGLEDAEYRLFVSAPLGPEVTRAAAMVPRVVLAAVRPAAEELTVRVDAGAMASGWIEGSITVPAGAAAPALLSLYATILRGGGFGVPQQRLDVGQTTFRIGPLAAGEYDLLCDIDSRGRLEQRGIRLLPGETLRLPPFRADAQAAFELVLTHADGRAAAGGVVQVKGLGMPCEEVAPGRYQSVPIAAGPVEVEARGPDFAPTRFALTPAGDGASFERSVTAGTPVQVVLKPSTEQQRWIGALRVRLRDAAGNDVVRDLMQLDGGADFTWPLALLPGVYALDVEVMGEGKASTRLTVGREPVTVELQLAK